jgi:mono/diheme cytochrome c family protein
MKKQYFITVIVAGAALISACNSGYTRRNPGKTYAPDMTYSQAYDAYTKNNGITPDSLVSQPPVEGTIARGQALPHHLKESDTAAYKALSNPYSFGEADIDEGRRLYGIHCGICHGTELDGNGPLFASGKFAAMPANLKDPKFVAYTGGQIYHAIIYGKNMMGSYASQLDEQQRWKVIAYIKKAQGGESGASQTADNTPTETNPSES